MADAIVARDLSLRESLDHKDTLMREIHHRVKNNLQIITSLPEHAAAGADRSRPPARPCRTPASASQPWL